MFTLFGIVLLVAGAILTFAVDRQTEGVDLQLVGWILMAGGGLSLFVGMVRAAGVASVSPRRVPAATVDGGGGQGSLGHDPGLDVSPAGPNDVVRHERERDAA